MTVFVVNPKGNGTRTVTLPQVPEGSGWKRLGPDDAGPQKPRRSYIWWYEDGQLRVKYLDEFKEGEKVEIPPFGGACMFPQAD